MRLKQPTEGRKIVPDAHCCSLRTQAETDLATQKRLADAIIERLPETIPL